MLLAIDIGNTNIDFALIAKNGRILNKFTAPTKNIKLPDFPTKKVDRIIVVSVVPKALLCVKRALKTIFSHAPIYVSGRNIHVPLKCLYDKREIGQDRLITAFAASALYGLPILIIDFGTAVTFDVVSRKGEYMGGLILPGIKMSLESLHERTALLPKTYLKRTRSFIGRDTESSIRNGMIYGYSAICEGLIDLFKEKFDRKIKIVATGGDARLISRYAPSLVTVDKDLSLKGLYLLSQLKT